jgi:Zinc finger, C2H2 type
MEKLCVVAIITAIMPCADFCLNLALARFKPISIYSDMCGGLIADLEDGVSLVVGTLARMEDSKYTCHKCSSAFSDNAHLRRHLARKTPCDLVLPVQPAANALACKRCRRSFTTRSALSRHIHHSCKAAAGDKGTAAKGAPIDRPSQLEAQNIKIDALQAQLTELSDLFKEQLRVTNTSSTIVNNTTIQAAQVMQVVAPVTLNFFGQEATPYIEMEDIMRLATEPGVQEKPERLLVHLCGVIYGRPENATVMIPNKKEPYALVYTGEPNGGRYPPGWQMRALLGVLGKMVIRSGTEIKDKVDLYDPGVLKRLGGDADVISRAKIGALYDTDTVALELQPELQAILLNNGIPKALGARDQN